MVYYEINDEHLRLASEYTLAMHTRMRALARAGELTPEIAQREHDEFVEYTRTLDLPPRASDATLDQLRHLAAGDTIHHAIYTADSHTDPATHSAEIDERIRLAKARLY